MAVKPNTPAAVTLSAIDAETGRPFPSILVQLQRFDLARGDFLEIAQGTTGADGFARLNITLPTAPGRYRYRSRWPGSPELRADVSPEVVVEVVP